MTQWVREEEVCFQTLPDSSRLLPRWNVLERRWISRQLRLLFVPLCFVKHTASKTTSRTSMHSVHTQKNKSDSRVVLSLLRQRKHKIDSLLLIGGAQVSFTAASWDSQSWGYSRCGIKQAAQKCDKTKWKWRQAAPEELILFLFSNTQHIAQ